MRIEHSIARIVSLTIAVALCFTPASWAQSAGAPQNPASPAQLAAVAQSSAQASVTSNQQDRQQTTANAQTSGTTVNPSQPPLLPVTTYPDAAGNPQKQMDPDARQTQAQTPTTEPQGAATAEKVPTAGGAAAKPAGAAIAPAKQRQVRSLLIKLGAVAAGAVAAGTVYALSKGTPSVPPGSGSPGAVQKR